MTPILGLLTPSAVVLVAAGLGSVSHRRLGPRTAAFVFAALMSAAAVASLGGLGVLGVSFLAEVGGFTAPVEWCRAVADGAPGLLAWIGAPAVLILARSAWRGGSVVRRARHERRLSVAGPAVRVVRSSRPEGFAVGGRHPHVVITTGMLGVLKPSEQSVLLAHEQAHLRHHHDRLVLVAAVGEAVAPWCTPLANRLRFALERWADEDAAAMVGDRRLAARALAIAALAAHEHRVMVAGLAMTGSGVPARVEALLGGVPAQRSRRLIALALIGTAAAIVGAGLQVHHLAEAIAATCLR